ncbi:hypothetical protein [Streptomyces sp. KAU_LT]|uniref:hypothetical protein n=1 Tax=Streptomyces sp. KAU_LT TaxID=3046669 RepID=UPI0024B867AF|nr:hypothetical protein [Streptomyces sp. KAU_LT]MDI9836215.1 hypothetical protein [Streptomyces sp. KAU_LT]
MRQTEGRLSGNRADRSGDRPVGHEELLALVRRVAGAPEAATYWRGRDLVAVALACDVAASPPPLDAEREEPQLAAVVLGELGVGAEVTAKRLGTYARQVARWREAGAGGA